MFWLKKFWESKELIFKNKKTEDYLRSFSKSIRERRASHPPKPTNLTREKICFSSLFCHQNKAKVNTWLAFEPPPNIPLKICKILNRE